MSFWPAPRPTSPLNACVTLPGSKSLTNRELILSALAKEPSTLIGALLARDTQLMSQALRAFGVEVSNPAPDPQGRMVQHINPPVSLGTSLPRAFIDCGLAGTVLRFVPPLAAVSQGTFEFRADPQATHRPLQPIFAALRSLGVQVDSASGSNLPFTVHGQPGLSGGRVVVDAEGSSQFVSALMLLGPALGGGIDITLRGEAPSLPHIEMTAACLAAREVRVHRLTLAGHPCAPGTTPSRWRVEAGRVWGARRVIEPDLSNAGPFLAAAGIGGGQVKVRNWPTTTTQAGDAWRSILPTMGMQVRREGEDLVVRGDGKLCALDLDLSQFGELVPTIAALCAFAQAPSVLRNVSHLRGHETDRLAAIVKELHRVGIRARADEANLYIDPQAGSSPQVTQAVRMQTYHDHRMATFAALLGLRLPVEIDNVETTSKTLPNFTKMWDDLLEGSVQS